MPSRLDRRRFLGMGLMGAAGLAAGLAPSPAGAAGSCKIDNKRFPGSVVPQGKFHGGYSRGIQNVVRSAMAHRGRIRPETTVK